MWPLPRMEFSKKHRCPLLTETDEEGADAQLHGVCPTDCTKNRLGTSAVEVTSFSYQSLRFLPSRDASCRVFDQCRVGPTFLLTDGTNDCGLHDHRGRAQSRRDTTYR